MSSQVLENKTYQNVDEIKLDIDYVPGVYLLKVKSYKQTKSFKLIKI